VNDSTSIGNSNIPKQSETTKSEKENRTIYKTDDSMGYNREQEK
jgi:hypothetical protein